MGLEQMNRVGGWFWGSLRIIGEDEQEMNGEILASAGQWSPESKNGTRHHSAASGQSVCPSLIRGTINRWGKAASGNGIKPRKLDPVRVKPDA